MRSKVEGQVYWSFGTVGEDIGEDILHIILGFAVHPTGATGAMWGRSSRLPGTVLGLLRSLDSL